MRSNFNAFSCLYGKLSIVWVRKKKQTELNQRSKSNREQQCVIKAL